MSKVKEGEELFGCNFPLYTIGTLGGGDFYVAGGGGQAKTGVPNAIVSVIPDGVWKTN